MMNLVTKAIIILSLLLTNSQSFAAKNLCESEKSHTECSKALINYPLFDTSYKLLANYLPILPLRAIAHGEIYRDKKSFKLERYYYVKNTSGAFKDHYALLKGKGEVTGFSYFWRSIDFKGDLNDIPLKYQNKMTFSLPKKATMKVKATIDDIDFLNLSIKSDGDTMTNDVSGSFFNKPVEYHTLHRDTNGSLAGLNYKIHTEGNVKTDAQFEAITEGTIDNYRVHGKVKMTAQNTYLSEEYYGPIYVKTYITIL